MFVILPNGAEEEINHRIDTFLKDNPNRDIDRDELYNEMIQVFGHKGQIPEIVLNEEDRRCPECGSVYPELGDACDTCEELR